MPTYRLKLEHYPKLHYTLWVKILRILGANEKAAGFPDFEYRQLAKFNTAKLRVAVQKAMDVLHQHNGLPGADFTLLVENE